jgi:hypothetical protein
MGGWGGVLHDCMIAWDFLWGIGEMGNWGIGEGVIE